MDIVTGLILCFILLLISVLKGTFLGYPLLACWIVFALIAKHRGHSLREIIAMSWTGARQSFLILQIFLLIGCIMSVWITAGTMPTLMYYCLSYIAPSLFVLFTFLMCGLVSFLIGSSFGTASTMGVALITLARGAGLPLPLVTGAVMSGIYVGDRGSFMSSAAILASGICGADHVRNVRNMAFTSMIPLALSALFYGAFSLRFPLEFTGNPLPELLNSSFTISPVMLLPATLMFLLPVLKVPVKLSMGASILCALFLSLTAQHADPMFVMKGMLTGVKYTEGPLAGVLESGGIFSMFTTYIMLFISCSLAGIFEHIHAFDALKEQLIRRSSTPRRRTGFTCLVGLLSSAFGCNQTISTLLTHDIMKDCYGEDEVQQMALDISNSALIIAGLVPWCVAAFVPVSMLHVESGSSYIPYAFYMYATPILACLAFPLCGKARQTGLDSPAKKAA